MPPSPGAFTPPSPAWGEGTRKRENIGTAAIPLGPGLLQASSGLTRGHRAGSPCRPPIWPCSGWGLPCPGRRRPGGELLPRRFTLAYKPPLPALRATLSHKGRGNQERKLIVGGLFSAALSVGSPLLDVIQHPALWSSDFPLLYPPLTCPLPPRGEGILKKARFSSSRPDGFGQTNYIIYKEI